MKLILKNLFFLAVCISFFSCTSDDFEDKGSDSDGFNRAAVLENWVTKIIVPSYNDFDTKLNDLASKESAFVAQPNESNLTALQTALFETQKAWQHVAMFEFGKAEELNFRLFVNTYPIDTTTNCDGENSNEDNNTLSNNLNEFTSEYVLNEETDLEDDYYCKEIALSIDQIDFTLVNRADEQGLPAIDYLINGVGQSNAEILSFYSTNANKENHKKYLTKVVDRLENLTSEVTAYWDTNSDKVIANSGSSATASFDKLVNDFLNYYEQGFREAKIATPSGYRIGPTGVDVNKVESFYSADISKALYLEAYTAVLNFYKGVSFDGSENGQSIEDYLVFLNVFVWDQDARKEKLISSLLNEKFSAIESTHDPIDTNFKNQIENGNTLMINLFTAIQKNVRIIKTNAFQSMGVKVDFVDGDGD